ncbi:hypothetical protein ACI7BZ_19420 [Xanthobacter sp. AM11]|uniref:hypothetical protein n=1 Tax=Xanthobacter sp. AM11 TaxID=3380643 RepID=UPI0039BED2CC
MTIKPDHLIELARTVASASPSRRPRQTNLRRAISDAYYAVFHHLARIVADELIGSSYRTSKAYVLAYRSLDHGLARTVCQDLAKATPPAKYNSYLPSSGFCSEITEFCTAFVDLQERRHSADYDPSERFSIADVEMLVNTATSAITKLNAASPQERRLFVHIISFKLR